MSILAFWIPAEDFQANSVEMMISTMITKFTEASVVVLTLKIICFICELQIRFHHHKQEYLTTLSRSRVSEGKAQPFTIVVLRLLRQDSRLKTHKTQARACYLGAELCQNIKTVYGVADEIEPCSWCNLLKKLKVRSVQCSVQSSRAQ